MPEKLSKRAFACFGLAVVLTSLGYGTTFLLPLRFALLGGTPQDVGEVLVVGACATLVVCPLVGHISDRLGQAGAAALAALLLGLAMSGFGLAETLSWRLHLLGALLGSGWALVYTLTPIMIAAAAPPQERVRLLTIVQGLQMIGMGGGPVLGRLVTMAESSVSATFMLVAAGCGLSVPLLLYLQRAVFVRHGAGIDRLAWRHLPDILRSPALAPIVMIFLGGAIFGSLSNFQTEIAAGLRVEYALFFAIFVAVVVVSRLTLARRLARYPPYRALAVLLAVMTLALVLLALSAGAQTRYAFAAALFALGYGLTYPLLSGIAANTVVQHRVAQSLQVFTLSYFLATFGFPYVSGTVITHVGVPALFAVLVALAGLELAMAATLALRELQARRMGPAAAPRPETRPR